MSRSHLEFLAEINNSTFAQNAEWFNSDLQLFHRSKECIINIGTNGNKTVQITFDSGSSWVDFATGKKLDFKDQSKIVVSKDDLVNFRTTDGSGIVVQHLHIYFKEF